MIFFEERFAAHPEDVKHYGDDRLDRDFVIKEPLGEGKINLVYSHYDRYIAGGVQPVADPIALETIDPLKAEYFLERREMGIINIGGTGTITVDGESHTLENKEALYIGRGVKEVVFSSEDINQPAKFYINSAPAHKSYPVQKVNRDKANIANVGTREEANKRTIYKLLVKEVIDTCQLQMGLTMLDEGCIWNTMPPHTHTRRMEVYFYFELDEGQAISHYMGEPEHTRKLWLHNEQAVISPPWSIHCGAGTSNYSFIWGMAGENLDYGDMDVVKPDHLF